MSREEEKEFWDYYESKVLPSYYYRDGTDITLFLTFRILANKTDLKGKLWTVYYRIFSNYTGIFDEIENLRRLSGETYMPFFFIAAHYYIRQHKWQEAINACHKITGVIDQISKEDTDYYIVYRMLSRAYAQIGEHKLALEYNLAWQHVYHTVTGSYLTSNSGPVNLLCMPIEEYPKMYKKNPEFYDRICPFIKAVSELVTENEALKKENVELSSAPGGKAHLAAKERFAKLNIN